MENWLTKRARLTPNRVAVADEKKQMTFSQVANEAANIAGKIAALGNKNDRVALIMTNNIQGYLVIMALQQLGKTIVFINRRLSVAEVNYQLADAAITLVLTDDNYDKKLPVTQQIKFTELPESKRVVPVAEYP